MQKVAKTINLTEMLYQFNNQFISIKKLKRLQFLRAFIQIL